MGIEKTVTPLQGRESIHGAETDQGYTIASTAEDALNTPTTTLAKLLVMGIITASGKLAQYDALAADGTEVAVGLLKDTTDMMQYSADGATPADNFGSLITHGEVDATLCHGLDLAAQAALTHVVWRNPLTA